MAASTVIVYRGLTVTQLESLAATFFLFSRQGKITVTQFHHEFQLKELEVVYDVTLGYEGNLTEEDKNELENSKV